MRTLLPETAVALLGSVIFPRDFLEIKVRDRSTGAPVTERLWSDLYDTTASVVDLDTGSVVVANWQGASGLVDVSDLSFVSNLSVAECQINIAAYGVDTDRIFRLYDPDHASVRIWRGFLNVETRVLVAPAESIFIGEIDDIQLPVGADGEEAIATLTCLSSQELTRSNPTTRSDQSQRLRDPDDAFFQYAATVADWVLWWGQTRGKIETSPAVDRNKAAGQSLSSIR